MVGQLRDSRIYYTVVDPKLLIVTTFSPASLVENGLRNQIFKLFLKELKNRCLDLNAHAILIGPETDLIEDSNVTFLKSDLPSKETKLDFAHRFLIDKRIAFEYITRLDDDDFLNPNLKAKLTGNYDMITDNKHFFFDLASSKVAYQQRPWFPNTTIMKREHAFAEPWEVGKSLFFHYDHSKAWHKYAKEMNFNVLFIIKEPVYLRLLSPVSITSSGIRDGHTKEQQVDWMQYFKYRNGFGNWLDPRTNERDLFPIENLNFIWKTIYGAKIEPNFLQLSKLEFLSLKSRIIAAFKRILS